MMQRHFLKSLMGFFVVVATSHLASAHSVGFYQDFSEEISEPEAKLETNIDPTNELRNHQTEDDIRKSRKNNFMGKFVGVQLEGSHPVVEVEQGESTELVCSVNASPKPKIYWVRGDIRREEEFKIEDFIESGSFESSDNDEGSLFRVISKFVIDCASKKDEGFIHCIAIAGDKSSIQSTFINVKENSGGSNSCKTERFPVITDYTSAMFSLIGSTVILSCKADGTPRPKIHWYDSNEKEIVKHRNSRYRILKNDDLLIANVNWSDMGAIKCMAESHLGRVYADTFLYPLRNDN